MRRWLLDLHLYLGLACLPYVVVFGVSSILLNHGGLGRVSTERWSAELAALTDAPPDEQASEVASELGLRGSVLRHTVKRTRVGGVAFKLLRPGRTYQVTVAPDGAARVVAADSGVAGILRGLHGASDAQHSLWSAGWALYTEIATATLLFSIASGVLLVLPRAGERLLGLGAAALGLVAVIALAAVIW
jgi:hypothetical protein